MLTHDTADEVREADYPQTWEAEGLTFPISYVFQPGTPEDGLTIEVPVATLNRVEAEDFSWNVPGLREELVTSLLRSLPKNLRVSFVPAPNTAKGFLARVPAGEEPLLDALERYLRSTTGVVVPAGGVGLGEGPRPPAADLPRRRRRGRRAGHGARTSRRSRLRSSPPSTPPSPRSPPTWGCPRPDRRPGRSGRSRSRWCSGARATRYGATPRSWTRAGPSGSASSGRRTRRTRRHRLGVRRLLLLGMRPVDPLAGLDNKALLGLAGSPYPTVAELVDDIRAAVAGSVVDAHAGDP